MKSSRFFACLLIFQLLVLPVRAQQATGRIDLDLSSTARSVTAGTHQDFAATTIQVGGTTMNVAPGAQLTQAEAVALHQVLNSGQQSIMIGATGNAVGGTMNLSTWLSQKLSSLVIPNGVTVVNDFGANGALNLSGNLTNAGNLYAVSTNQQVTNAIISANYIHNQSGATLSSVVPSSLTANMAGLVSNLSLTLQAVKGITNEGVISSAGHLNLAAPTVINHGLVAALGGNLQIANNSGSSLNVDNTAGTLMAAQTLSLRGVNLTGVPYEGTSPNASLYVNGGNLAAPRVEFESPHGTINVAADRIDGSVSVSGGEAGIGTANGDLTIASMDLTGDPIYYAQGGNLDLSGLFSAGSTYSTGGGDLVALATGDITVSSLNPGGSYTINTANASGNGGAITVSAGVNFTVTGTANATLPLSPNVNCTVCTTNFSITGTSATGGSVQLAPVSLSTNAGAIKVEARAAGTNPGTVSVGNLNSVGSSATAAGANGQNGGNLTVTAAGNVQTGALTSYGGGGAAGTASGQAGGNGGNGGIVSVTSTAGSINVGGQVNSSGGGGGGGSALTVGLQQNNSGQGGTGGNVSIVGSTSVQVAGPVLAASGGDGGTGMPGIGAGGGGGSLGAPGTGGGARALGLGATSNGVYGGLAGTGATNGNVTLNATAAGGTVSVANNVGNSSSPFFRTAVYGAAVSLKGTNMVAANTALPAGVSMGGGVWANDVLTHNSPSFPIAPTGFTKITSLDLTNAAVISNLQAGMDKIGTGVTGNLVVNGSGGADSGTTLLIHRNGIQNSTVTADNVPAGVILNLHGFGNNNNPLIVNLSAASTTQQLTVNGIHNFVGLAAPPANETAPQINVNSTLSGYAVVVNPGGRMSTERGMIIQTPSVAMNGEMVAGGTQGSIQIAGVNQSNPLTMTGTGLMDSGQVTLGAGGLSHPLTFNDLILTFKGYLVSVTGSSILLNNVHWNAQGAIQMSSFLDITTAPGTNSSLTANFSSFGTDGQINLFSGNFAGNFGFTGGSINAPGLTLRQFVGISTSVATLTVQAVGTNRFINIGDITTSGADGMTGSLDGNYGGHITMNATSNIQTGNLRALGGNGFSGTFAGFGGKGGNISLTTTGGTITVNGEVNSSGGKGASGPSNAGFGLQAGSITVTATGGISVAGTVLAIGGAPGINTTTGASGFAGQHGDITMTGSSIAVNGALPAVTTSPTCCASIYGKVVKLQNVTINVQGGALPANVTSYGNIYANGTLMYNSPNCPQTLFLKLTSLDLTNSSVLNNLLLGLAQPGSGVTGTLIINGGIATGGTLLLTNTAFANGTITAENIPSGVTVNISGFTHTSPLSVSLTGSSTSPTVQIDGSHNFVNMPNASSPIAKLIISSSLSSPALVVSSGGQLTSDGGLWVEAPSIVNNGTMSASSTRALEIDSVAGAGTLVMSGTGTLSSGNTGIGKAGTTLVLANLNQNLSAGPLGVTGNTVSFNNVNLYNAQYANLTALAGFTSVPGSVTNVTAGNFSGNPGSISVISSNGSVNTPLMHLTTRGGLVQVKALGTNGSINIGNISAYGADAIGSAQSGTNGGAITVTAQGNIQTYNLYAHGTKGGNGTFAGFGGNGGNISVTSTNGSVFISGDVEASGGNGGNSPSSYGIGGNSGTITITGPGSVTVAGTVMAMGGAGGMNTTSGFVGPAGQHGDVTMSGSSVAVNQKMPSNTSLPYCCSSIYGKTIQLNNVTLTVQGAPLPANVTVAGNIYSNGLVMYNSPDCPQVLYIKLTSLDLTDPSVVNNLLLGLGQAGSGVTGSLIVNGGIATGGTLLLTTSAFASGTITAENIPSGVTVNISGFTHTNPLRVSLSSSSTTPQVLINGSHNFVEMPTTSFPISKLVVTSTLSSPALIVSSGGQLTSDVGLWVEAPSIVNNGTMSASSTRALEIDSVAGAGTLVMSGTGTLSSGNTGIGKGGTTLVLENLNQNLSAGPLGVTGNTVSFNNVNLYNAQYANLTALAGFTSVPGSVTNVTAGDFSGNPGSISVISSNGSVNTPLMHLTTRGGPVQVKALGTNGSINIGNISAYGADAIGSAQSGTNGGAITVTAQGNIQTYNLYAHGTKGGNGTFAGFGGNGGNISVSSANGSVFISGDVEASGGKGGNSPSSHGVGGNSGTVTITGAGAVTVAGTVMAMGGAGGMNTTSGFVGPSGQHGDVTMSGASVAVNQKMPSDMSSPYCCSSIYGKNITLNNVTLTVQGAPLPANVTVAGNIYSNGKVYYNSPNCPQVLYVKLASLDLTDPAVVNDLLLGINQENSGVSGTLTVSGGVAVGGTLLFTADAFAPGLLSKENVPAGVTVNFSGFNRFSPLAFSSDVLISGTHNFVDMPALADFNAMLQAPTVVVANGGLLTSDAGIVVQSNAITNNGTISAASNYAISLVGPNSAGSLTLSGTGAMNAANMALGNGAVDMTLNNFNQNFNGKSVFIVGSNITINNADLHNANYVLLSSLSNITNVAGSTTHLSAIDAPSGLIQMMVSNGGQMNVSGMNFDASTLQFGNGATSFTVNGDVAANHDLVLRATTFATNSGQHFEAGGNIEMGASQSFNFAQDTIVHSGGNIKIYVGANPTTPVVGTAPSGVFSEIKNGGSIYYGANTFTALDPANAVRTDARVVVLSNGGAASDLTLGGGVVISANSTTDPAPVVPQILASLDLTDPAVVSQILAMQAHGLVGGTLTVSGGIASGGTALLTPAVLAPVLTAENIPANVVLTMQGFDSTNVLSINLTSTSTTTQVLVSGQQNFTSSGYVTIASDQAGPVLVVTGQLTAADSLTLSANGSINVGGTISAANAINVNLTGAGSITQTAPAKTFVVPNGTLAVSLGTGSMGSATNPFTISAGTFTASGGTGLVSVQQNAALNLGASNYAGTLTVRSGSSMNVTGSVSAGNLTLNCSSCSAVSLASNVNVAATQMKIFTSNLQFASGSSLSSPATSGTSMQVLGGASLAVSVPDIATIYSSGSSIAFTATAISVNKAAATTIGFLSLLAPSTFSVGTISAAGTMALGANTRLVFEKPVSINGPSITFANNGSLISPNGVALSISGSGTLMPYAVTLTGNGSFTANTTIQANNRGMLVDGNFTFSGNTLLNSNFAGTSITIPNGRSLASQSGTLVLQSPTFNLGDGATISSAATTGTAITIKSSGGLSLNLPNNGTATVSTAGGSVQFIALGGQNVTMSNSAGTTGNATLHITGGAVTLSSTAPAPGGIKINAGVTVKSQMPMSAIGNFTNNGTYISGDPELMFYTFGSFENNGSMQTLGTGGFIGVYALNATYTDEDGTVVVSNGLLNAVNNGTMSSSGEMAFGAPNGLNLSGTGSLSATAVSFDSGAGVNVSQSSINGPIKQLFAANGSAVLSVGTGTLQVMDNAVLQANEGDLVLQNRDTVSGSIYVGSNVTISASSTTNPDLGDIAIVIGDVPTKAATGSKPANLTVTKTGSGSVSFGSKGITVLGSGSVSVANSDIIFSTGGLAASAITIGGGLNMSSVEQPSTGNGSNPPPGHGGLPPGHGGLPPGHNPGSTPPGHLYVNDVEEESDEYTPVSYVHPGVMTEAVFSAAQTETAVVRHAGARVDAKGNVIRMKLGEALIAAQANTVLTVGDVKVELAAGTLAFVSRDLSMSTIRVLASKAARPAVLTIRGREAAVGLGEEVAIAYDRNTIASAAGKEGIAHRRQSSLQLTDGRVLARSEFSLLSMLQKASLMAKLQQSEHPDDRRVVNSLVKTAAVLMQATASHGAYR